MARPKKPTKPAPRRVKTITTEVLPADNLADDESPSDDEFFELEAFFDEIGGGDDVRYKLYRVEKGKKRQWLEDGTPETFSEVSIRDSFGPGDYLLRAIAGRNWLKSKQISIGAPRSQDGGSSSETVRTLELRLRELEIQGQQAREAEMRRSHELTLKMIESMGNGGGARNGAPTIDELISGVRNLRDLGGGGGPLASVKELLEVVDQVNTLRGGNDHQPGGDGGFLSWLQPIAQPILQALLTPRPTPLAASPALPVETVPVGTDPKEAAMKDRIAFLQKMKIAASYGKPVEFWVDYINLNHDIEEPAGWIVAMVDKYDWETILAGLKGVDAEVGQEPYTGWFKRLYELLKEPAEEEPAAAAEAAIPVAPARKPKGGNRVAHD